MIAPLNRTIGRVTLFLTLWACVSLGAQVTDGHAGIITPAQLNDYTGVVKATVGNFVYQPVKKRFTGTLTLSNRRAAPGGNIDGKLVVLLNGLPKGTSLVNAGGTIGYTPYILVPGGLKGGKTKTVRVVFTAARRKSIYFNPTVHQLVSGAVNARAVRALSQPFTVAAIPDTQVYAEEGLAEFPQQVDWVLSHAALENIAFVAHLGDVVDNGTDAEQWANATSALGPLLAQDFLPFSVVRGNHDEPGFFLQNIPPATTQGKPWFVDAAPGGLSQAQVFRVEGACFLHVGFQKDPTAGELAWANALLARPELRGLPVIISTHDFVDGSGRSVTGRTIWDEFVKNNPMVFLALNGHTHTEYALVSHNAANRPVYQMLSDYQDRAFGGNGLMRLVTVDPAQGKILVKTFSPYFQAEQADGTVTVDFNHFETDFDSQFEYSLNVRERLAYDTSFDFGAEPPAPPLPPLNDIPLAVSYSHVFQNRRPLVGTTTAYAGTVDVQINENNPTLNYGGEATLTTDMDDSGSRVHAFLRFDDIVGSGPGLIPSGSTITSAKLVFSAVSSTKGKIRMHRMLLPWGEHSTWMDFTPVDGGGQPAWEDITYLNTDTGIYRDTTLHGMVGGGVQPDDVEALSAVDATFTMKKPIPVPFILEPAGYGTTYQAPAWDPATGLPVAKPAAESLAVDLTAAVQAWANDPTGNHGWFFEPTSSDGWDFETAEGKQPPALVVVVDGAPLVQ